MTTSEEHHAHSTLTTILLIVMVIITLIAFVVSIVQLSQIRKTSGYSTSTSLQNAYDFSIGVLVLNIFGFLAFFAAMIVFFRNSHKRSGTLVNINNFRNLNFIWRNCCWRLCSCCF